MGRKSVKKHNIEKTIMENGYTYHIIDGLKYTNGGSRLTYTPEFHENHKKRWNDNDRAYLVQMRVKFGKGYADISAGLGRTYGTCADQFLKLKNNGELEKYLEMDI